jgi:hypothetical protein
MIRIAILAVVIGAGLSALYFSQSVETFTLPEKEDVVRVEVKDELTERVAAAQSEAMDAIETDAKAAYEAAKNQALKKIELDVISAYRKEVQEKETALSKELKVF